MKPLASNTVLFEREKSHGPAMAGKDETLCPTG